MSANPGTKNPTYVKDPNLKPTKQEPLAGHNGHDHPQCAAVPEFKRVNYFYGQMLGVADFKAEQNYFREKLKLHNRCLHGYGVVCGLKVVPDPEASPCAPEDDGRIKEIYAKLKELEAKYAQVAGEEEKKKIAAEMEELRRELDEIYTEQCDEEKPTRVFVECGLAIDCCGNELVVRHDLPVDLWRLLSREDRNRIDDGEHTIFLSICYCEQPTDRSRPVLPDTCGATNDCNYGMLRDTIKLHVSVDPPAPDNRCATCCESCQEPCLLLARIDHFYRGRPLDESDIHNEVRRPLTIYEYTRITGISWTDGAEYTEDEAEDLMGANPHHLDHDDPDRPAGHMMIKFSRPILSSTIKRGVIDVWTIQGGEGRRGDIFNIDVEFVEPTTPTTDRIYFRTDTDESPNPGDRVLITVRTARLLDGCCRPVDGANTGGRTPFIADSDSLGDHYRRDDQFTECASPPHFGYGPWTSGTGAPGASFESWFYIKANEKSEIKKK